jgi:hypothetical protein
MDELNIGIVFCGGMIPKNRGNDVAPVSFHLDLKPNTS